MNSSPDCTTGTCTRSGCCRWPTGTLGVLSSASLAVHALGQDLAQAQGTLGKHAVKQVDRLLSNDGVVMKEFFAHWAPYMVGSRPEVLVVVAGLDELCSGWHETLVLSMLTSHGRATPLMWKTVQASTLKGNQTEYEEELVRRLARRDAGRGEG